MNTNKPKREKCIYCGREVHINKFAGFISDKDGKPRVVCNDLACLIEAADNIAVN